MFYGSRPKPLCPNLKYRILTYATFQLRNLQQQSPTVLHFSDLSRSTALVIAWPKGQGVVCWFGLLQLNKMPTTSFTYLILNLVGALLIMYSLLTDWNFTAFIIEAIWALISLYAMINQYFVRTGFFRQRKLLK